MNPAVEPKKEAKPPCAECSGSGWVIVERGTYSGAERCSTCQPVLPKREALPGHPEPVLTVPQAEKLCGMMGGLPEFPRTAEERAPIVNALRMLCEAPEQGFWLVERMHALYSKWHGLRELRILFCSKFYPLDGENVNWASAVYPAGIPSENRDQLPAPEMKALPPGEAQSDAPSLDRAVSRLAQAKDLNRLGPAPLVPGIPEIRVPAEKLITPAQIDAAVAEHRRAKMAELNRQAQEELGEQRAQA